jgi:hypothetical protein
MASPMPREAPVRMMTLSVDVAIVDVGGDDGVCNLRLLSGFERASERARKFVPG